MDGDRDDYAGRWEREVEARIAETEKQLEVGKRDYELTVRAIKEGLTQITDGMHEVRASLDEGSRVYQGLANKIEHLTNCSINVEQFNTKMEIILQGRLDCQKAVNDRIDDLKMKVDQHNTFFQVIGVAVTFIATGFMGLFGQFMGWWFSKT